MVSDFQLDRVYRAGSLGQSLERSHDDQDWVPLDQRTPRHAASLGTDQRRLERGRSSTAAAGELTSALRKTVVPRFRSPSGRAMIG